jgi:hypothetical protein
MDSYILYIYALGVVTKKMIKSQKNRTHQSIKNVGIVEGCIGELNVESARK